MGRCHDAGPHGTGSRVEIACTGRTARTGSAESTSCAVTIGIALTVKVTMLKRVLTAMSYILALYMYIYNVQMTYYSYTTSAAAIVVVVAGSAVIVVVLLLLLLLLSLQLPLLPLQICSYSMWLCVDRLCMRSL